MSGIARTGALEPAMVALGSADAGSMMGAAPHMNKGSGVVGFVAAPVATMVAGGCCRSQETSTKPAAGTIVGNGSDIDATEHVKTPLQQTDSRGRFDIEVAALPVPLPPWRYSCVGGQDGAGDA
jgi:hypothetical protein